MLEKMRKMGSTRYQSYVNNLIALIGFITASIWRGWGFTSLVCAMALFVMGAKPKQYIAVVIMDILFSALLYVDVGKSTFSQAITRLGLFQILGLLVWFFTLERTTVKPEQRETL